MRLTTAIAVLLAIVSFDLPAAHFRDGGWLADPGVLESVRIDPRLPKQGESFTVTFTGSWPEVNTNGLCRAPLRLSTVTVYPSLISITSAPQSDSSYCDQPPASWSFDATVPASAWDTVDENGYMRIEHQLFSGINMLTGINQVFDMRLGTHEVPAFIGSGFWVSADRPFEGILVEQQGSRVLFYGLGYDKDVNIDDDDGEPVWLLVAGEMYGDSTLGRSYRYDWPLHENHVPLENPTEMDLLSVNNSGAIIVDDYNHIRVFTSTRNNLGLYHSYKRIEFGIAKGRLPGYVPPLSGRWTLYGFDGQNAEFTASVEFLQGSSEGANQYRFDSAGGDWLANCTVVAPGDGDCVVEHSGDGAKLSFPITAFQGNLARGGLDTGVGSLDGVLVRAPWQLPVVSEGQ